MALEMEMKSQKKEGARPSVFSAVRASYFIVVFLAAGISCNPSQEEESRKSNTTELTDERTAGEFVEYMYAREADAPVNDPMMARGNFEVEKRKWRIRWCTDDDSSRFTEKGARNTLYHLIKDKNLMMQWECRATAVWENFFVCSVVEFGNWDFLLYNTELSRGHHSGKKAIPQGSLIRPKTKPDKIICKNPHGARTLALAYENASSLEVRDPSGNIIVERDPPSKNPRTTLPEERPVGDRPVESQNEAEKLTGNVTDEEKEFMENRPHTSDIYDKSKTQEAANPTAPPNEQPEGQQNAPGTASDVVSETKPHVVIAASVKQSIPNSKERAEVTASNLRDGGFADAKVYDGRDFPNFKCCFWVVIVDAFETSAQAVDLRDTVKNAGFDCYVKNAYKK